MDPFNFSAKTFVPGKFKTGNININEIKASCFHEDKAGNFWIGSNGASAGLAMLNRQTNKFSYYSHNDKDSNSLSSHFISLIDEDKSGNLWIGTDHGLNLFQPANR